METLGDSLYSSGQLGTLSSLSILAPLSSEHIAICCLPLFKIKTILGGKSSYNWVPWHHDMHILLCEALHAQFPTFGRFVKFFCRPRAATIVPCYDCYGVSRRAHLLLFNFVRPSHCFLSGSKLRFGFPLFVATCFGHTKIPRTRVKSPTPFHISRSFK